MTENNQMPIAKIELFDFMDAFFTNKQQFSRITDSAKLSHSFMLRRFLSIKFPQEIQYLNTFDDVAVIDALHAAMCKGSKPRWIYTKSNKNKSNDLDKYKNEIQEYCHLHDIEPKSFELLYALDSQTVIKELNELQELKEQKVKRQKTRKR